MLGELRDGRPVEHHGLPLSMQGTLRVTVEWRTEPAPPGSSGESSST